MRMRWMVGLVVTFGLAAALEAAPVTLGSLGGSYYSGDGLGVNRTLSIYPDGRFEYAWDGCLGRYASAQGRVSMDEDRLLFEPSRKEGEGSPFTRLRVLPWGERIYLVPEDELLDLANAINHGDEPRSDSNGFFYLRRGDWERPVTGAPELPASYKALLLTRPVSGKILSKGKRGSFEIDRGSRDGLKPGMELFAVEEDLDFCGLTVLSTSEDSAIVQGEESCERFRAGTKVCSRFEGCVP